MKNLLFGIASAIFITPLASDAQSIEKVDTATISKIKNEGNNRSQVMSILSMLTDIHGPRLTNSPGYKRAADYAKSTLEGWGAQNVHFDVWDEDFGRGWQLKKFSLSALGPVYFPLIAHPKAWSPGIKGTVQADAIYLDIKKEEDLQQYKGKLKGKIVMFSLPTPVKPGFKPDATRLTDSTLLVMANSGADENFGGRRFTAPSEPQRLAYLKWQLCEQEGAIAVIEASPAVRLEDGTLIVSGATVPYPADAPFEGRLNSRDAKAPKILPQIVVAAEHYNRLVRQIQNGQRVKLELALETEFTPSAPGYNVIAEIPGTDLKDEIVMIGAHLDSWHGGTGSTDNGCGSAVMLEAIRILKSLGVSPRRTIRIALWGGEEQGLLGSRNYVKRILGQRLDKSYPYDSIQLKPAAQKFSIYLNMDNGSGKYRGVYLQGNQNIAPVFRAWLKPFEKQGISTLTLRNTSGTDHLSFDAIGLPGFQFIQDPIEYGTRTHHTTMDVWDKAVESDLKHNAIITAAFAWLAANRDGLAPRK
ncbi:M20/M25/M40 family metallo-hydrolase [Pseudochryseolinea flava]|uniref:Carboxypeptidase Q n=1 Tax=Pseudochryseolinea flava TaxID=2059302 RepID=A0A364Y7M0_9BACT|nr:M20/M25/M40 family metallo-hydrolase [Pseudochryseolinea flava]RAW03114.1 peptidase M28 [Pseudochryseolinea flava]